MSYVLVLKFLVFIFVTITAFGTVFLVRIILLLMIMSRHLSLLSIMDGTVLSAPGPAKFQC